MPNQFFSEQVGDIEDYFLNDYEFIDQYIGDTLWAWGLNTSGQLGINVILPRSTPITTIAGGTNWRQIASAATGAHIVAIKTDGSLWTWGTNTSGQLGINLRTTTSGRSTPVTTLSIGNTWKYISAGGAHTAAIKTDGTLWNWGSNSTGQMGVNFAQLSGATGRSTPTTTILGGNNWRSVATGSGHTLAIKTDGTLWAWGLNSYGQIGVNEAGALDYKSIPMTIFGNPSDWKSVSAGSNRSAAIKTDGTLWIWGSQVDNGNSSYTPITTALGGNNWKSVSLGYEHYAAIKTDGTLWCWGRNNNGQLGVNSTTFALYDPVTTLAGGTNWKSVACGSSHTIAIKTDGTLWTWGLNSSGQLGINDIIQRLTPITTILGGNNWKSVSGAFNTTYALTAGTSVDFR
jgi:alpha-tubulin suppressor-like RCC1 family protein